MQKQLLGLQRNGEGRRGEGGGGAGFGELCVPLKKSWLRPPSRTPETALQKPILKF